MLETRTAALCSRVGLLPPRADPDGVLTVRFAGGLTVEVATRGPVFLIRGTVCALPGDAAARDRRCRRLLSLALGRTLKEGTAGLPVLCEEEGKAVLAATLGADADQVAFEDWVESFLNFLESWKKLAEEENPTRPASLTAMLGGLRP